MPYRRACSADARPVRPAEGKCHAQECKAQGSAQSKALHVAVCILRGHYAFLCGNQPHGTPKLPGPAGN